MAIKRVKYEDIKKQKGRTQRKNWTACRMQTLLSALSMIWIHLFQQKRN